MLLSITDTDSIRNDSRLEAIAANYEDQGFRVQRLRYQYRGGVVEYRVKVEDQFIN